MLREAARDSRPSCRRRPIQGRPSHSPAAIGIQGCVGTATRPVRPHFV
jgi:hypothetical protein